MIASRVVLAGMAVASLCALRAGPARGQVTAPTPPAPVAPPPAAPATHDTDDEEPAGSAAPAGPAAPTDPKARSQWLHDRVAQAIARQPRLASAKLAVSVVDLASGEELVAVNADRGMSLASVTKLLTSTAALATLGGGFRWRTAVYGAEPDDKGALTGGLYIKGRGDPTLDVAELDELAADVVARGVRSIDRLVVDASYFDEDVEPPHFADQKTEAAAFRAPVASLGIARSAVTITVVAEPGGTASVKLTPDPGDYFKIVNKGVISVRKGRTRLTTEIKTIPERREIDIIGQIRWAEGSWEARKRVDEPVRFAAEVFRRLLGQHGVKIRNRTIDSENVPPTAKLLAAHDSAVLSEVLRHMNKLSDNYVAESLLKTLGAQTRSSPGPATWADGRAAVHHYLSTIGIPENGYRADNGSGLYDATEVSARQITTLLRAAHKDYRIGPDLVASLPVGGVDGTLAKRWHGRAASGRVRAKTGTLDKVSALAGYVAIDSERPLGFAVLVNDIPPGQRASARTAADEILDALVGYLDAR